MNKIILHDIENGINKKDNDILIINTCKNVCVCVGCFACWLKNPGKCIFKDDYEYLGANIMNSDEVVIISKLNFGTYSSSIKRAIDRCIPGVMPFFTKINKEMHHQRRYKNSIKLKVYFYSDEDISDEEKSLAKRMVGANSLNYWAKEYEVIFVTRSGLEGVLNEYGIC